MPRSRAELAELALASVRLIVFDVDGTLTDGRINYLGDKELVSFHVHDGQGIVWLIEAGIRVAWISGRGSPAVERRAKELGVRELHLFTTNKAQVLAELQRRLEIAPEHTLALGDDLVDLALLGRVALFVAPANARAEVAARADLVLDAGGGAGAARELAERVLAAQGLWRARVERTSALPDAPANAHGAAG